MNNKRFGVLVFIILISEFGMFQLYALGKMRQRINFNQSWSFIRIENDTLFSKNNKTLYDSTRTDFGSQFLNEYIQSGTSATSEVIKKEIEKAELDFKNEYPRLLAKHWSNIILPHTAIIEPIVSQLPNWEGVSYYRKSFLPEKAWKNNSIFLEFEGAMQQSDVWLNGHLVLQHKGGYTPFSIDLTDLINYDKSNELIVRLDNRANKNFPVGKDQRKNGFMYWSGIYRSVFLEITNPIYISDAVKANKVAGGGVFFRTPIVNKDSATVLIKTNVVNQSDKVGSIQVIQALSNAVGDIIAKSSSAYQVINDKSDGDFGQTFTIKNPSLWHPDHPSLYILKTTVIANGRAVDEIEQKVGFRKLSITREDGFKINNQPLYMVGTNRHHDYPYIGVALSKNAQYRDMKKIKEAGYNAVRLSHYPQDPAVYEAADEIGLMLLDDIPGWQFYNDNEIFKQRVYRDIRDMIHRDRNHPSIVLWEVNLNESYPPDSFRIKCSQLMHEELPAKEYFTTGETYGAKRTTWDVAMNNWYDPIDTILRGSTERIQDVQPDQPGLIKEYADWEFGGVRSTTRSSRATGEKAMLQGLWNTMWEHNANIANYSTYTIGDFTWAMFDGYVTGDRKLFEWGTNDYFRLPKFTGYFFRSQLEPYKKIAGIDNNAPVVFIANWWTSGTLKDKIIVFSNCDKIVLKLNNKIIGEQAPDDGPNTFYGVPEKGGNQFDGGNCRNLKHPPFTFNNIVFNPGILTAEGYIRGIKVAEQTVRTPEKPATIKIEVDLSGKPLKADGADAVFVHGLISDKNGTVCCLDNTTQVEFHVTGNAQLIGPTVVKCRGGIASILIQSNSLHPGKIQISAKVKGLKDEKLTLLSE